MDRESWRAAIHGVAKSRTRLKRLSSSNSSSDKFTSTAKHLVSGFQAKVSTVGEVQGIKKRLEILCIFKNSYKISDLGGIISYNTY